MSTDSRAQAVRLIESVPQKYLSDTIRFLELLSRMDTYVPTTEREIRLVKTIRRQLSPQQQQRLNELRALSEQGATLNESQLEERIHLEDEIEQYRADRLDALIELADLPHLELKTLNQQFKAVPPNSHAIKPGASPPSDQAKSSD